MLRSTILAIALPLAACASSPAAKPAAPAPAAAPTPATKPADTAVLSIAELAIHDKTGTLAMKLHADGRFELVIGRDDAGKDVWREIGTFAADGTFTSNAGDKLVFNADGTVRTSAGTTEKLFDGDVLVLGPQKRVRFDDSGVYIDNDQVTQGKLDGPHDAKARRTALAMITIAFILAKQTDK